jgi:hypothetical protein
MKGIAIFARSKMAPAVAVLHAGRGHQYHDEQADGVNDDVACAAVDLLGGVIATAVRTDLSAALTDRASTDPALAK